MINRFENMIGVTMSAVRCDLDSDEMTFTSGRATFRFWHEPDCCESVYIADVTGDLSDLVGAPILEAEEISSEGAAPPTHETESYTWTFYRFSTVRGTVTVRWLGESNGHYSEGVSYSEEVAP